ncbi:S9 family peptidase [Ameyamaea chiangmaiensis]|uniref:S9 family peptidase n=2 Tax=Ameyamaea chiangmaiensis TaxID=442969 RepID=A0A850P3K2_9PROT|nr:S9 family peptidase [Ameyamaea chiangmaiensis]NVN39245.1 S9 family peptidase [Ameyamaea chiangmaiensis]
MRGVRRAVVALGLWAVSASAQTTPVPSTAALSQVDGGEALAWVRARNDATFAALQADARYQPFYDDVLAVTQSHDRLALPQFMDGRIWNFWQDDQHPHGIWRATSPASFLQSRPAWTTRLDIDALARQEHRNWVFKGAECLSPQGRFCMVSLSDSGEDATSEREFDTRAAMFVTHGFALPRSKQSVAWVDRDTLLVARDWGGGSLTSSGYPFIVRRWARGQPIDQAQEVMRGAPTDVSVGPVALTDGDGHHMVLIRRGVSFFDDRYARVDADGVHELALPHRLDLWGLLRGRLILSINEPFRADTGAIFAAGSLLSVDPVKPDHAPQLLFAPSPRQALNEVGVSRGAVVVTLFDTVRGRALLFRPSDAPNGPWASQTLELPDMATVSLADASPATDQIFLHVEGYILPPQLWTVNGKTGVSQLVRSEPALFDATTLVVDQNWAKSSDGTAIPYFVVHRRDWTLSGTTPTLMTAYGGFQASYTPTYAPEIGRVWLAHGGAYVVANIRGGGEFGPSWHEAGRKAGRQKVYDDFVAVARDLFARRITQPRFLGIRGRSNGGLLMGVEFTQHPALWGAVIIGVPLLDMLHYETMAAGASWADEYGSMSVPAEKRVLEALSPLQHLSVGTAYPVPFIFTSTRDDRVGPVHARLFAARLEALGKPFFYYEDTEGGHSGTANAAEVAHERALEGVYLSRQLMDQH